MKENDGWVSIETMLKFNRLASLTKDPGFILTTLTLSKIIEVRLSGKMSRFNFLNKIFQFLTKNH